MKWEINEPRTHETSWIMTCHDTSQLNMISCNWLAETSRVTKDSSRFLLASVSWNKRCIWKLELDPIWTGNCVQRLKCECNESWPVLAPNTAHNLTTFSALNKLLTNYVIWRITLYIYTKYPTVSQLSELQDPGPLLFSEQSFYVLQFWVCLDIVRGMGSEQIKVWMSYAFS